MAVQDIVLDGFGSTGSVSLIITSGFSSQEEIVIEAPPVGAGGGGWPSRIERKKKYKRQILRDDEELMRIIEMSWPYIASYLRRR